MRSSLALLVSLGLLACKDDKPSTKTDTSKPTSDTQPSLPADDPFEKGLADLEGFSTRMCACNDVPCTDKVFEEFKLWRVAIRKQNPGKRPNPAQEQRGNAIDKAMKACRANVTAKPGSNAAGSGSKDLIEIALGELDSFKSKMCACKDKACADAVQVDYATWQRNLRSKVAEKPNAQQDVRGKGIEAEMKECRKKAETATPGVSGGSSKIDDLLAQMQTFRDKVCACTVKDCATKIQQELQTWLEQAAKDLADAKPTKNQNDKRDRLRGEMKTCVDKLK